jgi:hypothetical protein
VVKSQRGNAALRPERCAKDLEWQDARCPELRAKQLEFAP